MLKRFLSFFLLSAATAALLAQPKKVDLHYGEWRHDRSFYETEFVIPDTAPDRIVDSYYGKMAMWNGHEFEAVAVRISRHSFRRLDRGAGEASMVVHYPIDSRIVESDVAGAIAAFPNEDNTAWLFAHADVDAMLDQEARLRNTVDSFFGPAHRSAAQGNMFSLLLVINSDTAGNRAVANQSKLHAELLDQFHADTVAAVLAEARGRHIGYRNQNPMEAHLHGPVNRALAATVKKWNATAYDTGRYELIRRAVEKIVKAAAFKHAYQWRWKLEADDDDEGAGNGG